MDRKELNVKPLPGKIYVQLDIKEDRYGNVIISHDAKQQTRLGTVIAKGDDCNIINVGDRVGVPYWAGVYIHIPGLGYMDEKHKIMGEKEVMFFTDYIGEEDGDI